MSSQRGVEKELSEQELADVAHRLGIDQKYYSGNSPLSAKDALLVVGKLVPHLEQLFSESLTGYEQIFPIANELLKTDHVPNARGYRDIERHGYGARIDRTNDSNGNLDHMSARLMHYPKGGGTRERGTIWLNPKSIGYGQRIISYHNGSATGGLDASDTTAVVRNVLQFYAKVEKVATLPVVRHGVQDVVRRLRSK